VLRCQSPAIPNAIAALLLHIRDRTGHLPHVYSGWTEGNPIILAACRVSNSIGDASSIVLEHDDVADRPVARSFDGHVFACVNSRRDRRQEATHASIEEELFTFRTRHQRRGGRSTRSVVVAGSAFDGKFFITARGEAPASRVQPDFYRGLLTRFSPRIN
jgi:hypothetical protein